MKKLLLLLFLMAAAGTLPASDWSNPFTTTSTTMITADGYTKPVYDSYLSAVIDFEGWTGLCGTLSIYAEAIFKWNPAANNFGVAPIGQFRNMTGICETCPSDNQALPLPRHTYKLPVFDTARLKTIIHGGACSTGPPTTTWEYDSQANAWTNRNPTELNKAGSTLAFGSRLEGACSWDSDFLLQVCYGGLSGGSPTHDTWVYNPDPTNTVHVCGIDIGPNTYRQVLNGTEANTPPYVQSHAMAYDSFNKKHAWFGGKDDNNIWMNEIYLLVIGASSCTWSNPNPANPPGLSGTSTAASHMARPPFDYDSTRHVFLYYYSDGSNPGVTSKYDAAANTWTTVTTTHDGPVDGTGGNTGGFSMVYNPTNDKHFLDSNNGTTYAVWELTLDPVSNQASGIQGIVKISGTAVIQ